MDGKLDELTSRNIVFEVFLNAFFDQTQMKWNNSWDVPSNDPPVTAKFSSLVNVSTEGLNTNTPELKQSGQPTSGAAENSSRSKSSSQFWRIYKFSWQIKQWDCKNNIYPKGYYLLSPFWLTNVSASKNTHFENWVSFQQWSLVKVIPSSGRVRSAKLASSFESRTFTCETTSNSDPNASLKSSVHA